jgi:hypothetical protein
MDSMEPIITFGSESLILEMFPQPNPAEKEELFPEPVETDHVIEVKSEPIKSKSWCVIS